MKLIRKTAQAYLIFLPFVVMLLSSVVKAELAKNLFERVQDTVYQVRIIDFASSDKYTIGSGFKISADGYIATNFHVVSAYIHDPDKYRIELLQSDETTINEVRLVALDVIHDLAILKTELVSDSFLPLSNSDIEQGDRIFSMGNPRDLGMSIVEGTYNGFVQHSRYQKILFSGSLNPGMSGGPALNNDGEVIGINVSTGGDQISFLVPVRELQELVEKHRAEGDVSDYQTEILDSLAEDQEAFYQRVLSKPIVSETLGELSVPRDLDDSLRCWGHTRDDEEETYESVHQHCKSEDRIYVKNKFYVGNFSYNFEWITSKSLNASQFYSFLQTRFKHKSAGGGRSEKNVTDYVCNTDFIRVGAQKWKASACMREYKKYQGLHDMTMVLISVDKKDRASLASITASAISKPNAMGLMKKFVEAIQWTN